MEMRRRHQIMTWLAISMLAFFSLLLAVRASAQSVAAYSIKNGRMYIHLAKDINEQALDSFITENDLQDLDLKNFIKTGKTDSLERAGWKLDVNNPSFFIISKQFEPFDDIDNVVKKMLMASMPDPLFPATDNGIVFGVNRFRNKFPFAVQDSVVTFFLRNNKNAGGVMLAGSFNDWNPDALAMTQTDSGWIAKVKLGPGKYWYKFIVDGSWMIDNDNQLKENDGQGNINSVFYRPNVVFTLNGFTNAKKVFVAGSFNNWKPKELAMVKTPLGWQMPVYLAEGTHTYKFVVDGQWYDDEKNPEKLPDGRGAFNSVIRFGKPHNFELAGFSDAKQVTVAGSFNGWKPDELLMRKTESGWQLNYVLGPGNYEYKFIVDGKWISDPDNPLSSKSSGNSFLIIDPNYTFRLKGFPNAKQVFLAGDFNGWDPKAYALRREGEEWIFPVHLSVGKHLYKFIVDDKWINDPDNPLWEQNEYGTGNSIVWMGLK